MLDLNDARPQLPPPGDLIPDGTYAKLKLAIRPGGADGAGPLDKGLLKASQSSDARMSPPIRDVTTANLSSLLGSGGDGKIRLNSIMSPLSSPAVRHPF